MRHAERQTGPQASEQKFYIAFNHSPLALTVTSLEDGRLLHVNESFIRMTGYTRAETIGRTPDEMGLWVEPQQRVERFRRLSVGEPVPDIEARFRVKNGEERTGVIGSARVEIGGRECVLSSVLDITERKRAEQALRVSEAEARQLLQLNQTIMANMAEGMYAVDTHGLVTYVNAEAERLFGWKSEELLGRRMHDLTHYQHPDGSPFPIEECAGFNVLHEGRVLKDFEDTFIRKDGNFFPVSYSSSPLRNGNGDIVGLVVVFQDISDRKSAENALRESREELAAKLAATQRLQEISVRLIPEDNVEALYDQILDAAVDLMRSDYASIQMLHPEGGAGGELRLLAHRGFDPHAAASRAWASSASAASCGAALRTGQRVVIPDVQTCEFLAGTDDLKALIQTGIRACQSTPLLSRTGRLLGTISTHWRQPHQPSERDLRDFDLLARQAADLIERSQVEGALRESEARFRMLSDSAPALIWVNGPDGCEFVNRQYLEFLGVGLADVRGFGWAQFVHPEDLDTYVGAFLRALEQRALFEGECRFRRHDGEYRWIRTVGQPRLGAKGEFLGYSGLTLDITERQRREMNVEVVAGVSDDLARLSDVGDIMRVVAQRLGTHLNVSRCLFTEFDAARDEASVIHEWNPNSQVSLIGTYHISEFTVADAPALLSSGKQLVVSNAATDSRTAAKAQRFAALEIGAFVNTPYVSDGRWKASLTVHHRATHEWTADELELLRDVTSRAWTRIDRARAEQRLRESEAELRRASQIKDEFLATLSHELRTPLNAVLGWAHMLRTGTLRPEVAERAFESLERNARAQAQLVEDLLDVSRIVSGKLQMKCEPVDLATVMAAAVDTVRPAADSKRVSLEVSADPRIALVVEGDLNRLRQIVCNLLSNAVKFTGADGRVHVTLRRVNGEAHIVVRDTGEGIDKQFLPFVFDRFRQADGTTTRRHSGLGLGLAIVRHLTEAHGGRVSADSEGPDKGATFTVFLPLADMARGSSEPLPIHDGAMVLQGMRILVVDDQGDARDLIRALLQSQGSDVTAVGSAEEALHAIQSDVFDVLVADIGMPGQDGYSLIRAVRAFPEPQSLIPAIAVTAYASSADREVALDAGYNGHVAKPVEPGQLIATVARAASPTST